MDRSLPLLSGSYNRNLTHMTYSSGRIFPREKNLFPFPKSCITKAAGEIHPAAMIERLHQPFWVKLLWHLPQVTVTTPVPLGSLSQDLQLGHLKYVNCLRMRNRFLACFHFVL